MARPAVDRAVVDAVLARARKGDARVFPKFNIAYPEPRVGRRSACNVCRHAGLDDLLWTCKWCGARSCEHAFKSASGRIDTRRVDGTGTCHECRKAREAAFNAHFGLSVKPEEQASAAEDLAA